MCVIYTQPERLFENSAVVLMLKIRLLGMEKLRAIMYYS